MITYTHNKYTFGVWEYKLSGSGAATGGQGACAHEKERIVMTFIIPRYILRTYPAHPIVLTCQGAESIQGIHFYQVPIYYTIMESGKIMFKIFSKEIGAVKGLEPRTL